jgi:hypothetical protein
MCKRKTEGYRREKLNRKRENEKEDERGVSAFDRMLIKNFQSLPRRHKLGAASLV